VDCEQTRTKIGLLESSHRQNMLMMVEDEEMEDEEVEDEEVMVTGVTGVDSGWTQKRTDLLESLHLKMMKWKAEGEEQVLMTGVGSEQTQRHLSEEIEELCSDDQSMKPIHSPAR
jgi:hypothetical protein